MNFKLFIQESEFQLFAKKNKIKYLKTNMRDSEL